MTDQQFEMGMDDNFIPPFSVCLTWTLARSYRGHQSLGADPIDLAITAAETRAPDIMSKPKLVAVGLHAIVRYLKPTSSPGEQVTVIRGINDRQPRGITFGQPSKMLDQPNQLLDVPQIGPAVSKALYEFVMAATTVKRPDMQLGIDRLVDSGSLATAESDSGEPAADASKPETYELAGGRIEVPQGQAKPFYILVDGSWIRVSKKEYDLISFLAAPGRIGEEQSYAELNQEVWGAKDARVTSAARRTIYTCVEHIRGLLGRTDLGDVKTGVFRTTDLGFVAVYKLVESPRQS